MISLRTLLLVLIGAVSIAFMGYALYAGAGPILAALTHPESRIVVAGAVAIYAAGAILLGLGWALLARMLVPGARIFRTLAVFLLAQAARYVPGNVAHLIGRVTLSKEAGLSGLTASTMLAVEIATLAAIGALAALYLAPRLFLTYSVLWHAGLAAGIVLGLGIAMFLVFRHTNKTRMRELLRRWTEVARDLWQISNLPFLLGYGLIVVSCFGLYGLFLRETLRAIDPAAADRLDIILATVIFASAWLFGFLTPGAPAGIGVREAVLVLLLSPIAGKEVSLAVAAFSRVLSVLGDVVVTPIGFALFLATSPLKLSAERNGNRKSDEY